MHSASPPRQVSLSTAPGQPLTHWKQDLFPLHHPVAVAAGDVIRGAVRHRWGVPRRGRLTPLPAGTFRVRRNPRYRRHLRVHLAFAVSGSVAASETRQYLLWR